VIGVLLNKDIFIILTVLSAQLGYY